VKLLLDIAARLYPQWWRDRYGPEFETLLEDAHPGFRCALDILKGALLMQFKSPTLFRNATVGCILGLGIALAVSLAAPRQWSSQAAIQTSSLNPEVSGRLVGGSLYALSRAALTRVIRSEGIYKEEISRHPIDDVIVLMRSAIKIERVR